MAARSAVAAVVGVVTADDRPSAAATATRLVESHEGLVVVAGGAFAADLVDGVLTLPRAITAAAEQLDLLLHGELDRTTS